MLKIRSPKNEQAEIPVPPNAADLRVPYNGELCSSKGDCFPVKRNIIDMLQDTPKKLTAAENSNHFGLTAAVYEDLWRTRSLSILTGHDFPIEREARYLVDWIEPKANEKIIDLGCSTALYARLLKKACRSADLVALDFSEPMLVEARKRIEADQLDIYLLRADARQLPFFAGDIDAIVCGGTLNEFSESRKVLYEARRILKDGGRFFLMHLLEAETWYGKLLQSSAKAGGITFWSLKSVNELFESCGFTIKKQHREGIVCFTLLEAQSS